MERRYVFWWISTATVCYASTLYPKDYAAKEIRWKIYAINYERPSHSDEVLEQLVKYFLDFGITMNGENYLKLLQDKVEIHQIHIHGRSSFMHDGAPCHKVKKVQEYRKFKVITLKWPGNSPDLNPIENLWDYLKNKLLMNYQSMQKHVWVLSRTSGPLGF